MIPRTPDFLVAEDRVKVSHFTRQGFDLGTVVHVGASTGLEAVYYLRLGSPRVLLFEPVPLAVEILRGRFGNDPRVAIFPFALGDHSHSTHMAPGEGTGKGSTCLREYANEHVPWLPVECLRFDQLDLHCELDPSGMNTLVVDVQGMELQVLRGFGEQLQHFSFLNIECSAIPLYDGEATGNEVTEWLYQRGFDRQTPIEAHDDVMFIRRGLKP